MIHNIPEPELSPNFTIDDIHRLREWHYEVLKDATPEEAREFDRKWDEEAYAYFGAKPGCNPARAAL